MSKQKGIQKQGMRKLSVAQEEYGAQKVSREKVSDSWLKGLEVVNSVQTALFSPHSSKQPLEMQALVSALFLCRKRRF